jgi:uncharacterized protein
MQLTLNRPEDYLFVRAVAADGIVVVDRTLTRSFVLSPRRAIENWPVTDVASIDDAAIEAVLGLEPAILLIGSGDALRFPPQSVLAEFMRRGIGVEVMDNAAAARTYNVLASEARNVAVAFVLRAGGAEPGKGNGE